MLRFRASQSQVGQFFAMIFIFRLFGDGVVQNAYSITDTAYQVLGTDY